MSGASARALAPRRRALVVDTDGGVDDAQALLAAFRDRDRTRVVAITTVAGNVSVEQATLNVCATIAAAELDAGDVPPVFVGADRPLLQPFAPALEWHGADGLGGTGFGAASSQAAVRRGEHGAMALIRVAEEFAASSPGEELTLVTLGPLTNVALAVRLCPRLPSLFARLVLMGGASDAQGNAEGSASAEFNAHADPEAAAVVVEAFGGGSPPRLVLVTWDLTLRSGLPLPFVNGEWFGRAGSRRSEWLRAVSEHLQAASRKECGSDENYARTGFLIPDPLAMCVALRPEVVTRSRAQSVSVELAGRHTRGMTVVDWRRPGGVVVVDAVDMALVKELLLASL
jgi:purine nucleosidase